MQGKTRYINISLGIGGWKPFDASVVDKLGYGDCKALTNYMKTILDTMGIRSYFAFVLAGQDESDIDTSFPSSQFNHVFICVPLKTDTIWLECTNQKNPFGFVGSFTANRHALIVTPEGGKLVQTPNLSAEDNLQMRKAEVTVDEEGNGTAVVTTKYTGFQYDDRIPYFFANADDQKKELLEDIDIPSFKIDKWNYTRDEGNFPCITENLQLQLENYTATSGKRIFLTLNLMNKSDNIPASLKSRKTNVLFHWSYIDTDTIIYNLPENLKVEFLPEMKEIKSEFGIYTAIVKVEGNKLIYIRSFKHNNGQYPASKYNNYINFRS